MSGWIPSPRCRRGCADWNSDWALLAAAGTASEAEAAIQRGLDVARRQNAKSWELRCATSLARLWRQQGRHQDALALLAPVYGWFTEGFDTHDLRTARALLDEFAGTTGPWRQSDPSGARCARRRFTMSWNSKASPQRSSIPNGQSDSSRAMTLSSPGAVPLSR
jgi:hypothetical protein